MHSVYKKIAYCAEQCVIGLSQKKRGLEGPLMSVHECVFVSFSACAFVLAAGAHKYAYSARVPERMHVDSKAEQGKEGSHSDFKGIFSPLSLVRRNWR